MDESVPEERMDRIAKTIERQMDGALEVHDVRTRRAGPVTFVEFHLVVPEGMTVGASHEICDRMEEALHCDVPGCMVTIHVEPEGKAKHHVPGVVARLGG